MMLNRYQKLAYNKCKNEYNLFITGGAGTGKSFLINSLKEYYNGIKENDSFIITSTTGLSALNINGQTIHSWAGLTPETDTNNVDLFVKSIQNNYSKLNNYLYTKTIVIDEISMLDGDTLDFLNEVIQKIRNNNQPFGGIQVILIGDFYQIPPVNNTKFAFQSSIWDQLIDYTIILKEIYRQNDNQLTYILNKIRKGYINKKIIDKLNNCKFVNQNKIYTHLYPNKKDVLIKNLIELDKLKTNIIELNLDIKFKKKKIEVNIPLNIEETLKLKIGAFIMLTRNIDFSKKLVNGTQGIFKGITENKIIFETLDGVNNYIHTHTWDFENYTIEQFPICLAWAITIHKSQGMGIEYLSIDIGKNVFEYGQAYVALSRSKTLEGLHIKKFDKKSIKCNQNVKDFYTDLFNKSNKWYKLDNNFYENSLSGFIKKKLKTSDIIINRNENNKEYTELDNCKYTNYNYNCKICNYLGCKNDYIVWYKEHICSQCIIDNINYKQLNSQDIYKMFTNYSKNFINTKLKIIYHKYQIINNRYKTKTKIYLLKHLKEALNTNDIDKNITTNNKTKQIFISKTQRIELTYEYLLQGKSIQDISILLNLSNSTIENYILDIIKSKKQIPEKILKNLGIITKNIKQIEDIVKYWKKQNINQNYKFPKLKYIKDKTENNLSYFVIKYVLSQLS